MPYRLQPSPAAGNEWRRRGRQARRHLPVHAGAGVIDDCAREGHGRDLRTDNARDVAATPRSSHLRSFQPAIDYLWRLADARVGIARMLAAPPACTFRPVLWDDGTVDRCDDD